METAVTPDSTTGTLEIPKAGPERDTWLRTGELPAPVEEKEEVETPADSSTAKDAQADSSAAAEETEAEEATETQVEQPSAPKPKKRSAEARIIELLEENKRLREAAKTTSKEAEPSPAPQELKKPNINDYKTMEEYETALDKYYRESSRKEALQAVQEAEFKRDLNSKVKSARERYEDFDAVAAPLVNQLLELPKPVQEAIDDSPLFADLLYVIGENEDNSADFLTLAKSNPRAAIKRIGALEQLIHDELNTAERARDDKGQFKAEKKVSKAPPPPTELGGTGGAPPDEVAAAVERGDFRAFKAAEDRRDIARRKGK